jgi:pSer/pThr/pTyr-binding forkhead associated (FHA) protein
VFCPECGFKNSDAAGFCARCGASLVADQPDDQTTISFQPGEEEGALGPVAGVPRDQPTLVIRSGGGRAGETYALQAERTTVGRHPDADIFLDDVTVSRNHAVLVREGERYVLADEGSLNGTYVNRKRAERTALADGDEIQIGKYKLTFIVP